MQTAMNQEQIDRHQRQNLWHTIFLLSALALILIVVCMVMWGPAGLVTAVIAGGLMVTIGRKMAPQMVLRMYKAKPVTRESAPALFDVVEELSRRAGLERAPDVYYVPSPIMNAFTTGTQDTAILVLFDGLIKKLSSEEVAGVIAHEIAHVKNNDTLVLGVADMVSRVTGFMPFLAIVLVLGNFGGAGIPWGTALMLFFAPQLTAALQMKLSQSREYDADLDGAMLTGNPRALASALEKIQRVQGKMLERVMLPGRKEPDPSHARSHPPTQLRIDRLLALEAPRNDGMTSIAAFASLNPADVVPAGLQVADQPRWRLTGLWH